MKNLPARERPGKRSRSAYNRMNKHPFIYPAWVVNKTRPPAEIRLSMRQNWANTSDYPPPEFIQG